LSSITVPQEHHPQHARGFLMGSRTMVGLVLGKPKNNQLDRIDVRQRELIYYPIKDFENAGR
jgi:hypothetical protein